MNCMYNTCIIYKDANKFVLIDEESENEGENYVNATLIEVWLYV